MERRITMPKTFINLPKPTSAYEFDRIYSSREACLAAVIEQRWPNGFEHPECSHSSFWMLNHRPIIQCSRCQKQINPLDTFEYDGDLIDALSRNDIIG
jgi:hypothetical protein